MEALRRSKPGQEDVLKREEGLTTRPLRGSVSVLQIKSSRKYVT